MTKKKLVALGANSTATVDETNSLVGIEVNGKTYNYKDAYARQELLKKEGEITYGLSEEDEIETINGMGIADTIARQQLDNIENEKIDDITLSNNVLTLLANSKTIKTITLPSNETGTNAKEIELQKSTDYIQWRYVGDTDWTNLIALSDLEGEKGEQGIQGIQGATGEKGDKGDTGNTGVGIQSVVQTTTSTEDGGSNVITVTKTDNSTSTFTVKNGSKGEKGDKGDKGDAGAKGSDANVTSTNVINALGYTPANQNDMNNIANQLGVDENKNAISLDTTAQEIRPAINEVFQSVSNGKKIVAKAITDKGVNTLATDTFQVMANNIGLISSGGSTLYSITNNFNNATNNNTNTTVEKYNSYSANITINDGYNLDSVTVIMGGVDITNSAYSNLNISIEHVTGDIVITVVTSVIPPNEYTVTNTLTQCTSNNSVTTATEGTSYIATLTANTGYTLSSVIVKMDDTDITNDVYSSGVITIANVTGNIEIIAIATENALYSFGVMSDIHIPSDETSDTVYGSKYKGLTKFTNVMNEIQNLGLDFICCTGDLTVSSNATQYTNWKNVVSSQSLPFYTCNGNHDMLNTTANETNWKNYVGTDFNNVFEKDNDVFIFMSRNGTGTTGDIPFGDETINWLETQLNTYKEKRVFLFMHEPLSGYAGLKTNEYYGFSEASTEDDRILALLKAHLNVHCFSGHTHYIFEMQENYSNINVATLDYYNVSTIHVPSLTQPRNTAGNMTDLTVSNQYLEMYKVDVYEKRIVLHAINLVTDEELYTYEISTDADYTKANSIITSTYNVAIDEGTTQTFTVKLEKAPIEDVVINLSSESQYVTVSPSTLTFTTENYSTEQTVTVNATDDGTTADYTTLIHLISDTVPNEDVNVAVTNTTVIDTRVRYDFSSFDSTFKELFYPENYVSLEEYPYVYLNGNKGEVMVTTSKIYHFGTTARQQGNFKRYRYNTTNGWYFYKEGSANDNSGTYVHTSAGIPTHANVDIENAEFINNQIVPTGEIHITADLFPL